MSALRARHRAWISSFAVAVVLNALFLPGPYDVIVLSIVAITTAVVLGGTMLAWQVDRDSLACIDALDGMQELQRQAIRDGVLRPHIRVVGK